MEAYLLDEVPNRSGLEDVHVALEPLGVLGPEEDQIPVNDDFFDLSLPDCLHKTGPLGLPSALHVLPGKVARNGEADPCQYFVFVPVPEFLSLVDRPIQHNYKLYRLSNYIFYWK